MTTDDEEDDRVQQTLTGNVRTRVVNKSNARTWDVDIGRADGGESDMSNTEPTADGWLGNPFRMSDGYSRQEAVDRFRKAFIEKLQADDEFRAAVDALDGKTLACHCKPEACHGDVVVAYIRGDLNVN